MQKVEELSGGQVRMAAGTLYGAVENLVKLKFIQPVKSEDSRRKVYAITQKGEEILRLDFERMTQMLEVTKDTSDKKWGNRNEKIKILYQFWERREMANANSKAGRYKRISHMWMALAASYIPIFAVLISTGSIDTGALLNLYYTPGLWEKSGAALWGAILFETPFAFLRGFFWLLLPIMIVLYLIFALKANKQYQQETNR